MIIETIKLYNFGPYEGEASLDTRPKDGKNIILIGGNNGAGKTTLFSAMRICLYGYMSMGYKNTNAHYLRAIQKMINNTAKLAKPFHSFVEMQIKLSDGRNLDTYILLRSWTCDESISESFTVCKNDNPLDADALADFEKYLRSIIPPDLFNLYFFDGERIADFFLEEGSNARIRSAFLTISGYDVFDIMRKQFKRVSASNSKAAPQIQEYTEAKDQLERKRASHQALLTQAIQCSDDIENIDAALTALEKDYYQSGGITQDEWNQKLFKLKEEEKKREAYNAVMKKWANEIVPFLIVRTQIEQLKNQIEKEHAYYRYQSFCEMIDAMMPVHLSEEKGAELKQFANSIVGNDINNILGLSIEQSATILGQIKSILSFDATQIGKLKRAISKSLSTTSTVRKELDSSNIASAHEYMKTKAELFEQKSSLLVLRVELEKRISSEKEELQKAEQALAHTRTKLEEEIKKASISDISARAIIMLDALQQSLYQKQIHKLEEFFRCEIQKLLRKQSFIEGIWIDDAFFIHPFRSESFTVEQIHGFLDANTEEQLTAILGQKAIQELFIQSGANTYGEAICYFRMLPINDRIILPVEIDKTSLSNGEKQIFIMALYHSLVRLCSLEIPFVIDTPFARIDTEHRRNISNHFFRELSGQVFILSTNEEINSDHVQLLQDRIAATYLLDNVDNKKTMVIRDSYFEV